MKHALISGTEVVAPPEEIAAFFADDHLRCSSGDASSFLEITTGYSFDILDGQGHLVWTDSRDLRVMGAPRMRCLGLPWERAWPDAQHGRIREAFNRAHREGEAHFLCSAPDTGRAWSVSLKRLTLPGASGDYLMAAARPMRGSGGSDSTPGCASDGLTGLPGAPSFHKELGRRIAEGSRRDGSFALAIIDVDDFKRLNHRIGSERCNEVLGIFANQIARSSESTWYIARSGGDEFSLILDDEGAADAASNRVAAIIHQCASQISRQMRPFEFSASAGISLFPADATNAQDLTRFAHTALRTAKTAGRGRCARFNGDMRQQLQRQSSMLEIARLAIARDWLQPYYQPKVDLLSGRVVGLEALLRWKSDDGVVHFPASIAAAFDEPEIAACLSGLMMKKVIADVRRWQRTHAAPPVAINASPWDFRDAHFADRFLAQIGRAGLSTKLFELEVTEGVFLGERASDAGAALRRLNAAGVRIALDDFGTGYASLANLKQHPIDIIKIDRSFVSNITVSPDDRAIVSAMVALGSNLAIEMVAEGIETETQASFLRGLGCQTGQGYLFGHAIPGNEVPKLFNQRILRSAEVLGTRPVN